MDRHSLPPALLHSDAERLLNHLQGRHKVKVTTTLPAVSSDEVEFELQTECRSDSNQCQGVSLREICESENRMM